jgi:hypothetical protein
MACETRAVPTASNGFIAAISRNSLPAVTVPSRGTAISPSGEHRDEDVQRLLRHAVELLHVQQAAPAHGRDQRPVDEVLGPVALGEHL